jgi:transcriptional regulator with XRE-family HTH domain
MRSNPRTPAAVALYAQRISQKHLARLYGCTEQFVWAVLTGRTPAPERFRSLVADLTNRPERELFPADLMDIGRAS